MIKARGPVRGGVAALTGLRETRLDVVRVAGGLIVLQVARRTTRIGNAVVPVYVALRTLQGSVGPGQWKPGRRVIKGCIPAGCCMASLASLRESRRHVIGIGCALEILQVARDATCIREVVVVVDVALRALD